MKLRRRQRERLSLGLQYLVFVGIIAAVLFAADWDRLADAFFRVDIIKSMFPTIITVALRNTILYTLGAFAFGLVFGTILALMRLSRVAPYRWVATAYIELFRVCPHCWCSSSSGTASRSPSRSARSPAVCSARSRSVSG